ncbi:DNA-directed RNA polymerase subunit P [Candidatus Pacearchaeota archaeon]|nr:DNA-directed RNA polymerase subunit P [Candidatus Pacearchaeota archaeon]
MKMANYKCFKCGKKITSTNLDKRFVCSSCGSKIFYKPRNKVKKVKAE